MPLPRMNPGPIYLLYLLDEEKDQKIKMVGSPESPGQVRNWIINYYRLEN